MAPTRRYFIKAHLLDKPPKPPKLTLAEQRQYALVLGPDGTIRHVNVRWLKRREALLKRAETMHRQGQAHRWTSEEARKVAKRLWKTRWRFNRRIGRRIGKGSKRRPAVDHKALRARYALEPMHGVQFHPDAAADHLWDGKAGHWTATTDEGTHVLSERAALVRLGHLPGQSKARRLVQAMQVASAPKEDTDGSGD